MSLRCLGNCQLHKNPSLFFEEHCTRTFHLLLYLSLLWILFLSWSSSSASTHFYENQESLMRLNVFFFYLLFSFLEGFRPQNVLTVLLFSMKHSYLTPRYLVTAKKITKLPLMKELLQTILCVLNENLSSTKLM